MASKDKELLAEVEFIFFNVFDNLYVNDAIRSAAYAQISQAGYNRISHYITSVVEFLINTVSFNEFDKH